MLKYKNEMGVKEERAFGWGIPLKIILVSIVLFLVYRYGSWMISGAKTANVHKDIMITPILEDTSVETAVESYEYYYVDLETKKIYKEETTETDLGVINPVLSILSRNDKKVRSRDLSDEEIKYLIEFATKSFVVKKGYSTNYTLEYNTDRIAEYHKVRNVSYKEIAPIINKF